ncbi:MAG TPA: amidohydrolase family protein [Allosphingosinicella sp.]|nr:amidohydrolase family protein [Allosphingosinicella sp.]
MKLSLLAAACAVLAVSTATAQVPADQLMAPPADARRFLIVSGAGEHGRAALWRDRDGTINARESILLRGFVFEQDQAIHVGPTGVPDRVVVRGVDPSGDVAETFEVTDGTARWTTRSDEGTSPFDGRSYYVTAGGPFVGNAAFAEALYRAPGQRLSLLPNGEARLVRLTEATVGEGERRRTVTAYAVEGVALNPQPVWLNSDGSFFAIVSGLALMPEGYADARAALEHAQEEALAQRSPAIARRFGRVPAEPVAFTNVRLFDADSARFVDGQTVVAEAGRITAVGPTASMTLPASARIIDGSGKTLVPGLWDSHLHVGSDSQGVMLLSMGVTSARDPGGELEPTVRRRARVARGELLFPTVYSSVLIDGAGPLQAQGGVSVDSPEEAVAAVRRAHEQGFTGVKFYTSMQREWLIPGIQEAHRLGLHVHGHIPAGMRPTDVIAAGYDEITHINFVMMQAMPDEVVNQSNGLMRFQGPGRHARHVDLGAEPMRSLIADMARRGIVVDPTVAVFEGGFTAEPRDLSPAYAPFLGTMPPVTERSFRGGGFLLPEGVTRADYRASFARLLELTGALHRAGVPIVAGTDGFGLELIRELELYVQAGMTPAQALQTATIRPAQLVGAQGSTGSIAVGKEADMFLVDGDPSRNIGDLRRTLWVMSDGLLMSADELRQAAGFTGAPR